MWYDDVENPEKGRRKLVRTVKQRKAQEWTSIIKKGKNENKK